MSNSSSFIESLLEIPYFASLAEENGIAWLTEIFQELGISEYDFGFMTAAVESLPAPELVTVDDVVEAIGDAVEASATPPVSAAAASAGNARRTNERSGGFRLMSVSFGAAKGPGPTMVASFQTHCGTGMRLSDLIWIAFCS